MANSVDPDETPHSAVSHLGLYCLLRLLIVLGFNDTSTLVGHFVSSPRERENRDRRDSRRDEKKREGKKEEQE